MAANRQTNLKETQRRTKQGTSIHNVSLQKDSEIEFKKAVAKELIGNSWFDGNWEQVKVTEQRCRN